MRLEFPMFFQEVLEKLRRPLLVLMLIVGYLNCLFSTLFAIGIDDDYLFF